MFEPDLFSRIGGIILLMKTFLRTIRKYFSRKNHELTLRHVEARFQMLADSVPVFVWIAGTDRLRSYVNKRWLDYTGRTLEQETGHGWTADVHPEDLDRWLKSYALAFDARKEFKLEYRLRRHDGAYRWVLAHGIPIFLSNGQFSGYIGVCVDIHAQK